MTNRRRYHYDENTPFIELFKFKSQRLLLFGNIAEELKGLLMNGDTINIRKMNYLEFQLPTSEQNEKETCTCKQIYLWLARLLNSAGKEGTQYGKSTIFRYLTDGHSNLSESESSLQTSVNRERRKISLTNIWEHVNSLKSITCIVYIEGN